MYRMLSMDWKKYKKKSNMEMELSIEKFRMAAKFSSEIEVQIWPRKDHFHVIDWYPFLKWKT